MLAAGESVEARVETGIETGVEVGAGFGVEFDWLGRAVTPFLPELAPLPGIEGYDTEVSLSLLPCGLTVAPPPDSLEESAEVACGERIPAFTGGSDVLVCAS